MHKTAGMKICAGVFLLLLSIRQVLASDMELGGFDIQIGVEGEDVFFWEADSGNSTESSQKENGGDTGDNRGGAGADIGNDRESMGSDAVNNKGSIGLEAGSNKGSTGLEAGSNQGSTGLDAGSSQGSSGLDAGSNKGIAGFDTGSNKESTGLDDGSSQGSAGLDTGNNQGSIGLDTGSSQGSTGLNAGSSQGSIGLDAGDSQGNSGLDVGSGSGSNGLNGGNKGVQGTITVSQNKATETPKPTLTEKEGALSKSPTKGAVNASRASTSKKKPTEQSSAMTVSGSVVMRDEAAGDLQTEQVPAKQTKEIKIWQMEYESAGEKEPPRIQVNSCEGVRILSLRWNKAEISWYWREGGIYPVFVPEKGQNTLDLLVVCEKGDSVTFSLSE